MRSDWPGCPQCTSGGPLATHELAHLLVSMAEAGTPGRFCVMVMVTLARPSGGAV